jgi:hypothetical protein
MITLTTTDDYRHNLKPGEHEAFYFLFTSPDGQVHGFLRTLLDRDAVLELVALHFGGRTWVHQQRIALPAPPLPASDASGAALNVTCLEPWQGWQCRFQATLQEVGGGSALQAGLDLTFAATDEPACYGYGSYQQAQQDGWLTGHLSIGPQTWEGKLLCYRDHSWGQRPMGAASAWTIACLPGRFYVAVVEMGSQVLSIGRFFTSAGHFVPVRAPQISTAGEGWSIEDPQAGLARWLFQRLSPPLVAYLGLAGHEDLRDTPQPGDLYRDDIGPVQFTAPDGRKMIGFLEQARRLK